MPLRLRVLCSGSAGNLTLLEGDSGERILIDVGVRPSVMANELGLLGVDTHTLTGAVLTHAHGDHANVRSLDVLSAAGVPVHATDGTWDAIEERVGRAVRTDTTAVLTPGAPLKLGRVTLHACRVAHDNGTAGDAVCCRAEASNEAVGYATDLGTVDDAVLSHLRGVGLLVLESNHDVNMLAATGRPWQIQEWIRGAEGHLRNEQAATALATLFDGREGAAAILAHLSSKANLPALALSCAERALHGRASITLDVAAGSALRTLWTVEGGRATASPFFPAEIAGTTPTTWANGTRTYTCGTCGGNGHNRLTCLSRARSEPIRAVPVAHPSGMEHGSLRRPYRCSGCGATGHNAATCATRTTTTETRPWL